MAGSWNPLRKVSRANDSSYLRFQTSAGKKTFGLFTGRFQASAPLQLPSYTVAEAEALAEETIAGAMIYVSNGAGGNPCLAISNGTNFLRCDTLAAISAT